MLKWKVEVDCDENQISSHTIIVRLPYGFELNT